jgi:glutaredoxin
MRTREEILTEIDEVKQQLQNVKGTETEIYTRIVGYYRSLKNWNRGKKEEYFERKLFKPDAAVRKQSSSEPKMSEPEKQVKEPVKAASIVQYRFYHKQQCPNCIPMKAFLKTVDLKGTWVDVDSREGLDEAMELGVMSTPTVIFFDVKGNPIFRCEKPSVIKDILENAEKEKLLPEMAWNE